MDFFCLLLKHHHHFYSTYSLTVDLKLLDYLLYWNLFGKKYKNYWFNGFVLKLSIHIECNTYPCRDRSWRGTHRARPSLLRLAPWLWNAGSALISISVTHRTVRAKIGRHEVNTSKGKYFCFTIGRFISLIHTEVKSIRRCTEINDTEFDELNKELGSILKRAS